MAVDIELVCAASNDNQGAQSLALGISVIFAVYTFLAIALSGATIVLASNLSDDGKTTKYKRVGDLFVQTGTGAGPTDTASSIGVPLVPMRR